MYVEDLSRIMGTVVVAIAAACSPLLAQTASTPEVTPKFEVASIRQNQNPNPAWRMEFTPDGVTATDVTLLCALHQAYGIGDDDLWSGGPAWLDKARFDINAKYDVSQFPDLTIKQRQEMLQQLLADRFKLVVHHEAKEFPLYALVLARGGPKFEATKSEDLRKSSLYGVMCLHRRSGRGEIEMQGCTTTQFADTLAGSARFALGRKVIDQTQLTGHYTFSLRWAPMDTAPSTDLTSEPSGPSVFTAVKEQLGLELKPIKGPLDTVVVDHAEMPSEN